jgi:predicted nucleic acid-binding Zn ribbon protein
MRRLGDLLPQAAAELGLEEALQRGRAMAAWQRLVEERVPAAAGASRLLDLRDGAVIVAARAPIVAQELRLRAAELLAAFAQAPGGQAMRELRVVVRPEGGSGGEAQSGPDRAPPARQGPPGGRV